MKVDQEDLILSREFRVATDIGAPQPSWSDIEARASRFSLHRPRKHFKLILACAVVLLAAACGASIVAVRTVYFKSAPRPFQSAIYSFASIGGPPGTPANKPSVVAEPRRVLTLALSNGATDALWVAPTVDGNYCFDTQEVIGDPDAIGTGLDWGGMSDNPGCGKHDRALDVGYDIKIPAKSSHGRFLILGGSGLRNAGSMEVRYEDGSSTSAPTVYVTSPVDASFFMFEIPIIHAVRGHRPKELILRARGGSILASDREVFSNLWRNVDHPKFRGVGGYWGMSLRPNSPGYQQRVWEYPGAGAGIS
jgi:hypothetical protein